MDNIIIEKIWIDDTQTFFKIKVTASNDRVAMSTKVYADEQHLLELEEGIKSLHDKHFSLVWGDNDDNNKYIDRVKFNIRLNKRGVAIVSLSMKSHIAFNYVDNNIHDSAEIPIFTDLASLDRFALQLKNIINGEVGTKIKLHEQLD